MQFGKTIEICEKSFFSVVQKSLRDWTLVKRELEKLLEIGALDHLLVCQWMTVVQS